MKINKQDKDYVWVTPELITDLETVIKNGTSRGAIARGFGFYNSSCVVSKILNGYQKKIRKENYYRLLRFLKNELKT